MKIVVRKTYEFIVKEEELIKLISVIDNVTANRLFTSCNLNIGRCGYRAKGLEGKWFINAKLYDDEWFKFRLQLKKIERKESNIYFVFVE